MTRPILILLAGILLIPSACDLVDQSIGDSSETGNDDGTDGTNDTDGTDGTGPGGDEGDCTAIGCEDALFLTLSAEFRQDGAYALRQLDALTRELQFGCTYQVVGGEPQDADCFVVTEDSGLRITLPASPGEVRIEVSRDGVLAGLVRTTPDYQPVFPNGERCPGVCTQAELSMEGAPAAQLCESLQLEFAAETEAVRGCSEAAQCGQLMSGTSCGCTRDWVARTDADLTRFSALADEAVALECEWLPFGTPCDCPMADGFVCNGGICDWNYL